MARMTRSGIFFTLSSSLVLSFFATGCGPDAKDQKIKDLSAENDQLKNDLGDREHQLNDAMVREGDARNTIEELNQQLAKMRADGGKPKEIDGWVTMPTFDMISIPGAVLFESGKSTLTPTGRSRLQQIASDIRARYSDRDIFVFGHTDDQPIRKSKWKDNWELGANRSLTVIRTLSSMGIPNDSLIQANCSEYRPKSPGSAEANRKENRRVEFYAVKHNPGLIENSTARGSGEE